MLLEAQNLTFGYKKERRIIDDVTLSIDRGERVALVGPSGCGKSTLSQILAGYIKPQKGMVLWEGKPLPKKGYCPIQLIYQHPEKAINPRWKLGRTLTEAWQPDPVFLEEMGIEPAWMDRYPIELSGGELQRFCIARAMGPETKFLIADEMTTMLDVITQAQIWQLMLQQIEKRQMGMMMVTHNEALAKQICNRIIDFQQLNL
ncbi:ABC transporter ATP-binding protein [Anaerosporobacter faecicola]|uniref:ABC transporter ATP-binding protein n=1 Tax=Anaerosporobacter faecicola TaxID=2718714 RepID=UPI00143932B2|nr:ATP-binding cassette domain-containing protein [Anaerosporobacter faecicola]